MILLRFSAKLKLKFFLNDENNHVLKIVKQGIEPIFNLWSKIIQVSKHKHLSLLHDLAQNYLIYYT
jgi:hypothetical protein